MKPTIFKIAAFVLLFCLIGEACKKEEDLSYLDMADIFETAPGFAIYKTKKDYFFNVPVTPYLGNISSPRLWIGGPLITLHKGKYYYTERYRLIENYIVSGEVGPTAYFTSLSYDEYIRQKLAPGGGQTNPKVINSIVDRDPFTEYYRSPDRINGKSWISIDDLNQIIKEKNLEKYLIKIK